MFCRQSSVRSAILLTTACLLLVAYSSGSQPEPPKNQKSVEASKAGHRATKAKKARTIVIDKFLFQPHTVTVRAGETVVWKNAGIVPHTAISVDGKTFGSGIIAPGATWRFKTDDKGTFDYLCSLHPNMKGKLVVR
jgi:plastocyanin